MTPSARKGVRKFHFQKQCGNCHRMPFWTMTNMRGSGMDVPSWRGANDRWKNAPQNRFFFADFVRGDTRGFPERFGFTSDRDLFQMIVEGSMGFSGALGRQVTLNAATAELPETVDLLRALEISANAGGVVLQVEGIRDRKDGKTLDLALQYGNRLYRDRDRPAVYSRARLIALAAAGEALFTITGRLGHKTTYDYPQPTLRPFELPILPMFPGGRPAEFPELYVNKPIHIRGEHIQEGAYVLVNGRRVGGSVRCEAGRLPNCRDDVVVIRLDELPHPRRHVLAAGAEPGGSVQQRLRIPRARRTSAGQEPEPDLKRRTVRRPGLVVRPDPIR